MMNWKFQKCLEKSRFSVTAEKCRAGKSCGDEALLCAIWARFCTFCYSPLTKV